MNDKTKYLLLMLTLELGGILLLSIGTLANFRGIM